MSDTWTDQRLYGMPDAECLHLNPQSAAEEIAGYDEPTTYPHQCRAAIVEHSVAPRGQYGDGSLPHGADLAERAAEWYGEDCWFEQIYDELMSAAKDPDVIAAFQAAIDALASRQKFAIADCELRTGIVWIDAPGEYRIEWAVQS